MYDREAMAELDRSMGALVGGGALDPCGRICAAHLATRGKRIRAGLALGAGGILGVSPAQIRPWAAAVELLHNASLIHDDLQDGDRTRRGAPTVWVAHGMGQAVAAGDLLVALPTLALGAIPVSAELRWALAELLARAISDAARGQALELSLRPERLLDWGPYLHAVGGKSGALFALPVEGALVLARHKAAPELAAPFRALGVLYQLRDDVLDLYAEGSEGGGSDLREGRVSALVVAHLVSRPADRGWLLALLDRPGEATDEDIAGARVRFRESGALDAVLDRVESVTAAVRNHPVWTRQPALAPLAEGVLESLLASMTALRCVAS